jgi:hypothetical protein
VTAPDKERFEIYFECFQKRDIFVQLATKLSGRQAACSFFDVCNPPFGDYCDDISTIQAKLTPDTDVTPSVRETAGYRRGEDDHSGIRQLIGAA